MNMEIPLLLSEHRLLFKELVKPKAITITNEDDQPLQIRLRATSALRVSPSFTVLQPNKSLQAIIERKNGVLFSHEQKVFIKAGLDLYELPLHFQSPFDFLQFPAQVNLGKVQAKRSHEFIVKVFNHCRQEVRFQFGGKQKYLKGVTKLVAQPECNKLCFFLACDRIGSGREGLDFFLNNQKMTVFVNWVAVASSFQLRYSRQPASLLDFGQVMTGSVSKLVLEIVNCIDKSRRIYIQIVEPGTQQLITPHQQAKLKRSLWFQFPSELVLGPEQTKQVELKVHAPVVENARQLAALPNKFNLIAKGDDKLVVPVSISVRQYEVTVKELPGRFLVKQVQSHRKQLVLIGAGVELQSDGIKLKRQDGKWQTEWTFQIAELRHVEIKVKQVQHSSKCRLVLKGKTGGFSRLIDLGIVFSPDPQTQHQALWRVASQSRCTRQNLQLDDIEYLTKPQVPKLRARSLKLPKQQHAQTNSDGFKLFKLRTSVSITFASKQSVSNIFPSEFSSSLQKMQCQRTLSQEELLQVQCGPILIDFGSIKANQSGSRTFWVNNGTSLPIFAQIFPKTKQLAESYKLPQIVPAHRRAGFALVMSQLAPGRFSELVEYKINSRTFEFKVQGEGLPLKLGINRNKIVFVLNKLSLNSTEKLVVHNDNSKEICFSTKFSGGPFACFPSKGTIQAGESQQLMVTLSCHALGLQHKLANGYFSLEQKLILQYENSRFVQVSLGFTAPQCQVRIQDGVKYLVSVFQPFFEVTLTTTTCTVEFPVQLELNGSASSLAVPQILKAAVGKQSQIKLRFSILGQVGCLSSTMTLRTVGKTVTVGFWLQVFVPMPSLLSSSQIDLGIRMLGRKSEFQKLCFKNQNANDLPLTLNLNSLIALGVEVRLFKQEERRQLAVQNGLAQVVLLPGETAKLLLQLTCNQVGQLSGLILVFPEKRDKANLKIKVRVTCELPVLQISDQQINFGQLVADGQRPRYFIRDITFLNLADQELLIQLPVVQPPVEFVNKGELRLLPGAEEVVRLRLVLNRPGFLSRDIRLSAKSQITGRQFLFSISIQGKVILPDIRASPTELTFRPVPLGFSCCETVVIENHGFSLAKFTVHLQRPQHESLIELSFVDRPELSLQKPRARFLVTARGNELTSVTTFIVIAIKGGPVKRVRVNFTAINSVMLTFPLFKSDGEGFQEEFRTIQLYLGEMLGKQVKLRPLVAGGVKRVLSLVQRLTAKRVELAVPDMPPHPLSKVICNLLGWADLLLKLTQQGYYVSFLRPELFLNPAQFQSLEACKKEDKLPKISNRILKRYQEVPCDQRRRDESVLLLFCQLVRRRLKETLNFCFSQENNYCSKVELGLIRWLSHELGQSCVEPNYFSSNRQDHEVLRQLVNSELLDRQIADQLKLNCGSYLSKIFTALFFYCLQSHIKGETYQCEGQVDVASIKTITVTNRSQQSCLLFMENSDVFTFEDLEQRRKEKVLPGCSIQLQVSFLPIAQSVVSTTILMRPINSLSGSCIVQHTLLGKGQPPAVQQKYEFEAKLHEKNNFQVQVRHGYEDRAELAAAKKLLSAGSQHIFEVSVTRSDRGQSKLKVTVLTHEMEPLDYKVTLSSRFGRYVVRVVVQAAFPQPSKRMTLHLFYGQLHQTTLPLIFEHDKQVFGKMGTDFHLTVHPPLPFLRFVQSPIQRKGCAAEVVIEVQVFEKIPQTRVLICCSQGKRFIRTIQLNLDIRPKPVLHQLKLEGYRGQTVNSRISLHNDSAKPWRVELLQAKLGAFKIKMHNYLILQPGQIHEYVVQFLPDDSQDYFEGFFKTLVDDVTEHHYRLTGSTSPFCEQLQQRVVIEVGSPAQKQLGFQKDMTVTILHCDQALSLVRMGNCLQLSTDTPGDYKLLLEGRSRLKETRYRVQVLAIKTVRTQQKLLITLRKTYARQFWIKNETLMTQHFEVKSSDPLAKAQLQSLVQPGEKAAVPYSIISTAVFIDKQVLISATSNNLIFQLTLLVTCNHVAHSQNIQTFMGEVACLPMHFQNPTDRPAVYKPKNKPIPSLRTSLSSFMLQPFAKKTVFVEYCSFLHRDVVNLVYESSVGPWEFAFTILASRATTKVWQQVECRVGERKPFSVVISNGTKLSLKCQWRITDQDGYPAEQVQGWVKVQKQHFKNLEVPQLAVIELGLVFEPRKEYDGRALLKVGDPAIFQWEFGLQLKTEPKEPQDLGLLSCQTRQTTLMEVEARLSTSKPLEQLSLLAKFPSSFKNCLFFRLSKVRPQSPSLRTVVVEVRFRPMKPFAAVKLPLRLTVEDCVLNYGLTLQANPPPPQDNILLEGEKGRPFVVKFRLNNITSEEAKFRAFFKKESDQLQIKPEEGFLPAFSSQGQQFLLSYSPKEYRFFSDLLVIQTEQMYWSYSLKCRPKIIKKSYCP